MNSNKNYTHIFLALLIVTLVSLVFRLINIENLPSILNRDEAALAYNALLLGQTGMDEWGRSWPVSLESFGDYKLPGYVLVLVGLFKVLPYSDWVVRLPAVLAGCSLIPLSYFLARNWKFGRRLRLFITLSTAMTPVFFFYSRIAFESILALSYWLIIFNLVFFESATKKLSVLRDICIIVLTIVACFTYNTPFLLLPFLILVIPLIRGVRDWKKWVGLTTSLLLVFISVGFVLIPLTSQKSGITIFSDQTVLTNFIFFRESLADFAQPVIGNKYLYFSGFILKNVVSSFSPQFLVISGGNHPWHSLPNAGNLLLIQYVLGLFGLWKISSELFLASKKVLIKKQSKQALSIIQSKPFILLFLLLTSLAPSIITTDAPHTTRSLPFLFWWLFVSAEGLIYLSNLTKRFLKGSQLKKSKKQVVMPLLLGLVLILMSLEFSVFLVKYFYTYPSNQPSDLVVGFDRIIKQAEKEHKDQSIAVVDGGGYLYIVAAWYLQVKPDEYFATIVRQQPNQIGFRYGEQLLNYHFIAHAKDREKTGEKILLNYEKKWEIESF